MTNWLTFSELEDNIVKRKYDYEYWIWRWYDCHPEPYPPELCTAVQTLVEQRFLFWKYYYQIEKIYCARCGEQIHNKYHMCSDISSYLWEKKRKDGKGNRG